MNTPTFDLTKVIRPHLNKLRPYSTARDDFKGKADVFLDANENPYPAGYNRYPDPRQTKLKEKISSLKKIAPENIFIGNGSDEAIDLIIRMCCEPGKDAVLIADPTYGMYEVSAQINNIRIIKIPLTEYFELKAERILKAVDNTLKVIFLCSPNNPSGNLLSKEEVRKVISAFKGLVVVDEAYIDFADDAGFLPELHEWPNLIVMQTLSKAFGLAGLRIGLAFAHPDVIRWLNMIKPPYNISQAAQINAIQHLENTEETSKQVRIIKSERKMLTDKLSGMSMVVEVFPSDANFLLVRFADAKAVYQHLLRNGIIVRDRSSVLHGSNCLRITVGTPEENKRLIDTLKQFE